MLLVLHTGLVAGVLGGLQQGLHSQFGVVEADYGLLFFEAHVRFCHAIELGQRSLHGDRARHSGHAGDGKRYGSDLRRRRSRKQGKHDKEDAIQRVLHGVVSQKNDAITRYIRTAVQCQDMNKAPVNL